MSKETPAEADAREPIAEFDLGQPKAEPKAKAAKADEADEPEAKAEGEEGDKKADDDAAKEEPARDKQGRFERRKDRLNDDIAQLTATKRSTERQVAELLRKADGLRSELSKRPNIDPADFEAQDVHRVRTAVKSERLEQLQSDAKELQERAASERYESFQKKIEVARDTIPDLDEALEVFAALPISDYAADLIADSDVAPQLARYLAKHPREAREINAMSPHRQGAALARIEARLSAAPEVRKVSQAPAPVPTVGGSKAASGKDVHQMSVAEMQRHLYPERARR